MNTTFAKLYLTFMDYTSMIIFTKDSGAVYTISLRQLGNLSTYSRGIVEA